MYKPVAAIFALALPFAPAVSAASAVEPISAAVRDYEAYSLGEDPITAGQEGDRAALSKLPDISLAADARRKAALQAFQARIKAIPADGMSDQARLNRDFLAYVVNDALADLSFDTARFSFSSDGGPDTWLSYIASSAAIRTNEDAQAYIERLEAFPKLFADAADNARRGMKTGWTQPRPTVEAVIERLSAPMPPVDQDPLLAPLAKLPSAISADQQAALQARAKAAVETKVRPAKAAFLAFVKTEYLPKARPGLGVGSVPGGADYYAFLARSQTTTKMTPAQIHAVGQAEVARIRAEMDAAMKETGFTGTFPQFLAFLRSDPRFYAQTPQDLLEKASEIAKRIDDKLPGYFATLPRLTYGVRPVPAEIAEGYTTGRYFGGSPKQGIAGGYMVNTTHLDQRPLYELPSLTLHEAVPGHHLQISLAQELEGVPSFRRNAGMSAFTEGWGLYSEKLGTEMGIYRDAYERFGRLSYEMWRACRLVADTGIHAMGWSIDQARACFADNSALAPKNIEVELARYVSWPGQALAYKVGELKILEERKKAEGALGPKFDIRRFHDAVLLAGPLPLDLLDARIDRWIAAEKAR